MKNSNVLETFRIKYLNYVYYLKDFYILKKNYLQKNAKKKQKI